MEKLKEVLIKHLTEYEDQLIEEIVIYEFDDFFKSVYLLENEFVTVHFKTQGLLSKKATFTIFRQIISRPQNYIKYSINNETGISDVELNSNINLSNSGLEEDEIDDSLKYKLYKLILKNS